MPFQQEYDTNRESGDEQELDGQQDPPLSDEEERDNVTEAEQQQLKEHLSETGAKLKEMTNNHLKSLNPTKKEVQLKTKTFHVHLEGQLKEMAGKGLKPKLIDISSMFPGHIGQLVKAEYRVKQNSFPCSLAVTMKGAKSPDAHIATVGSDVMGHAVISPKETTPKFQVMFENPSTSLLTAEALNGGQRKTDAQLSFEKKYAGVNSSNLRTKGVHREINKGAPGLSLVDLDDESPVLQYYLDTSFKTTVAKAKRERFNEPLCKYNDDTKSFIMNKECFELNAADFETRLATAKTASFQDLALQFERVRVSDTCKDDKWTDPHELSYAAPNPDAMEKLLKQEQKLELALRVQYL